MAMFFIMFAVALASMLVGVWLGWRWERAHKRGLEFSERLRKGSNPEPVLPRPAPPSNPPPRMRA